MMFISVYVFLFLELAAVAWGDLKYRKVPNLWSLLNVAIFITLALAVPEVWLFSWNTFLWPVIIFLMGFFLYWMGIMGGGDAKFLSSTFLIIPAGDQEGFTIVLLVMTILASASLMLWRYFRRRRAAQGFFSFLRENWGRKYPFIPVVFTSWFFYGAGELLKGRW
jgi:prepilin peptidase CpaA